MRFYLRWRTYSWVTSLILLYLLPLAPSHQEGTVLEEATQVRRLCSCKCQVLTFVLTQIGGTGREQVRRPRWLLQDLFLTACLFCRPLKLLTLVSHLPWYVQLWCWQKWHYEESTDFPKVQHVGRKSRDEGQLICKGTTSFLPFHNHSNAFTVSEINVACGW